MNQAELKSFLQTFFLDCQNISAKKNSDYANDADPWGNLRGAEFIGLSVEKGILVRILDKVKRVNELLAHEPNVSDESMLDSLKDIANYSALLAAYRNQ